MKVLRGSFLFALIVCGGALSNAADTTGLKADRKPDTERQLAKIEQEWNEAYQNRDKATLTALCADDFQVTDADGKVADKARFIADAAKNVKIVAYTLSNLTARVYGETGIVTGQWAGTVNADDGNTELAFRFTDTFVRREGRWWAVASQMTRPTSDVH